MGIKQSKMKIVLLPGLDGTGELFKPFIEVLPSSIEVKIINYDSIKEQSYDELIQYVLLNLPQEDFILLAESFSGPIANGVALAKPIHLKSLILAATFLENPRPLLLKFIPSSRIFALPIPNLLIKLFFLGFSVNDEVIEIFKMSIKKVSPSVIRYRLNEIRQLKLIEKKLNIRTIYIQATNDKLVSSKSLDNWQKVCSDLKVFKVSGEHLILQANPTRCAEIATEEVRFIQDGGIEYA